jgi:hypothetical protein
VPSILRFAPYPSTRSQSPVMLAFGGPQCPKTNPPGEPGMTSPRQPRPLSSFIGTRSIGAEKAGIADGRFADRTEAFSRGNVLVSFLYMGISAVVDLDGESIVWARNGPWRLQHEPMLLDTGRMLLFDNQGGGDGVSRILEFDPIRMQPFWSYEGPATEPLFSASCGAVQRLDNGNTLITESDAGRAFEVTNASEIVWEFVSPHRAGDDGDLVATLFDLIRIPADSPPDWVEQR